MKKRLFRLLCILLCLAVIGGMIYAVEYVTRDPVIIGIIDTGISTNAIVTARAARLLQKNKNLTPARLREKLLMEAEQLDSGIKVLG